MPRTSIYFCSPSAGTTTFFSSNILASEPSWCIDMRISQPPMNSFSTYSWGIVGHSEYSLIPAQSQHTLRTSSPPPPNIPCLNSWSSNTLKAVNLSGSTPCMPRICMLALEKPHCGVSGVPFMNSTTGDEATARSIAERTSSERNLA